MIRLENVHKYFNRYKKNQIHVINNTSFTLDKTGLVAILGDSGSGKTTLLNAIGGLDKVSKGHIYIDGERITKRSSHKIDQIRNLNIGYIFQDYKLIDNMTVYENVALSLKIIGLKNKKEIEKRVMYALESVNMARYKNRPANMLSGGERQRVGIARALVKNPKIIIADEPTGNLDSKNSLEVMNIIKSISNKYLVILVTHEEELARFYATKIIELKDGIVEKIYDNQNNGSLNYQIENRIYLKDFQDIQNIHTQNIDINVYRDKNEDVELDIVFKNGNIYISSKNKEKLEVIENNSNIELINDHYQEIKDLKIDKKFDIESVIDSNFTPKYSSIFKLGSFINYGFKKILDYPILKKILLGGFFLSGMFIFYSVASIWGTLNVNDQDFIQYNKDYLSIIAHNIQLPDYLEYENNAVVDYIIPSDSIITFRMPYDDYLQTSHVVTSISGSISDISKLNKQELILGVMPNNANELVIDKMVLEQCIENSLTNMGGYDTYDDYLNKDIYLNNMPAFKIVGITDKKEPNVYTYKDNFINMISNSIQNFEEYYNYEYNYDEQNSEKFIDYKLLMDKNVKLVKGRVPSNDYEILLNKNFEETTTLDKEIDLKINNKKLKVVGYYENISNNNYNAYLVNNNMIKYDLIGHTDTLSIRGTDKEAALNYFKNLKMNVKDSYQYAKETYLENNKDSIINSLIFAGVILAVSLIEILLMIRSSFLSRIKEVGIYRAIGLKKSDIYKMFAGEILAITVISSFTGIIFMTYILACIKKVPYIGEMYVVNGFSFLISILLVLGFNLVVGLLPVYNTIRKTPAEILSRYDVD